jgi:hypothetical protein
MRIVHVEGNVSYQVTEQKSGVTLLDSSTNRSHTFKETYEALWCTIELIRNTSFDRLSEEEIHDMCKRSQLTINTVPKSLLTMLRREKISRTHYDQIFLKLLSAYRAGTEQVQLSNKTNFIIYHELVHLLRDVMRPKLGAPVVKV